MRLFLALVCLVSLPSFGHESNSDTSTLTFSGPVCAAIGITGKPYFAEEISEWTQTLADGTHIKQPRSFRKVWRDFDGRTRTERPAFTSGSVEKGVPNVVEIGDLVAGVFYVVDQVHKVVHKIAPRGSSNADSRWLVLLQEWRPRRQSSRWTTKPTAWDLRPSRA